MSLRSKMVSDMKAHILNTDQFAETILYKVYGGSNLTIKAVVQREQLQSFGYDQDRTNSKKIMVHVANDVDDGITSVNERFDKVSVPEFDGGVAIDWLVTEVKHKDAGSWILVCVR